MGGSSWSDTDYSSRVSSAVKSHGTAFHYDKDVRAGRESGCHKLLNPKDVAIRESRDSDGHPNSNAIIVSLDVTGSMHRVVKAIHAKLPTLMGILTRKNYIKDPQIMFTAVGDATCDQVPLQVGQFESGAEMEGDMGRVFIEGAGGGQSTESYELMAYFAARHTAIDCLEKRGKRGYCFIIGDEMPYASVKAHEVTNVIGGGLEADINTQAMFDELQKKYFTFFILPVGASHGNDPAIASKWGEIIGDEHVLRLEDPEGVSELIATQIGLCEGTTDIDTAASDLKEHGTSEALVKVVRGAVSNAYTGGTIAKVDAGTLDPAGTKSNVERL